MSHIFDHDLMLTLTAVRRLLILEIKNSSTPTIRANLAIMDFEDVLDMVMPIGVLDYLNRDPDNLRRTGK
jgi:hypothetical protein